MRIDSVPRVEFKLVLSYRVFPKLQKNLLYATASAGGDLGSCMEWVGRHMKVTQVRQEDKTSEQKVTLRLETELGHWLHSCLSGTERTPEKCKAVGVE